MEGQVEEFYREIYADNHVDQEESTKVLTFFSSIAGQIPPSKIIWIRATAFRIAAEFLSEDCDVEHNTAILRCVNAIVHCAELALLEPKDAPGGEEEGDDIAEQVEECYRGVYTDGVVDGEESAELIDFFRETVGASSLARLITLRATAFRIASEFLSGEDNEVNIGLLRSINGVVHTLEYALMEPKQRVEPVVSVEPLDLDASLAAAVQHLWDLDTSNRCVPGEDYTLNVQEGKKPYQKFDAAPDPLFSHVDQSVLRRRTYRLFAALLDNYVSETGVGETMTSKDRSETWAFIHGIMRTLPMQFCHKYCVANGEDIPDDEDEFKKLLYNIWFKMYTRQRGDGADSSGFEHVFTGEIKNGQVSGFHNWIQFYLEEKKGTVDYKGYIKPRGRREDVTNDDDHVLTIQFEWNGVEKMVGTSFIGVSPEFEIALYTMCFLVGEEENTVELNTGSDVFGLNVKCFRYAGNKIGTTFVEATEHHEA